MRCNEPGWIELVKPDGRRGVWTRVTDDAVELCAGREGDDAYVKFALGSNVTKENVSDAAAVVACFKYSCELAEDYGED